MSDNHRLHTRHGTALSTTRHAHDITQHAPGGTLAKDADAVTGLEPKRDHGPRGPAHHMPVLAPRLASPELLAPFCCVRFRFVLFLVLFEIIMEMCVARVPNGEGVLLRMLGAAVEEVVHHARRLFNYRPTR